MFQFQLDVLRCKWHKEFGMCPSQLLGLDCETLLRLESRNLPSLAPRTFQGASVHSIGGLRWCLVILVVHCLHLRCIALVAYIVVCSFFWWFAYTWGAFLWWPTLFLADSSGALTGGAVLWLPRLLLGDSLGALPSPVCCLFFLDMGKKQSAKSGKEKGSPGRRSTTKCKDPRDGGLAKSFAQQKGDHSTITPDQMSKDEQSGFITYLRNTSLGTQEFQPNPTNHVSVQAVISTKQKDHEQLILIDVEAGCLRKRVVRLCYSSCLSQFALSLLMDKEHPTQSVTNLFLPKGLCLRGWHFKGIIGPVGCPSLCHGKVKTTGFKFKHIPARWSLSLGFVPMYGSLPWRPACRTRSKPNEEGPSTPQAQTSTVWGAETTKG